MSGTLQARWTRILLWTAAVVVTLFSISILVRPTWASEEVPPLGCTVSAVGFRCINIYNDEFPAKQCNGSTSCRTCVKEMGLHCPHILDDDYLDNYKVSTGSEEE